MPGFDRTGPTGYGPMTGRGFGPCGYGRGRGFRRFAGVTQVQPSYPYPRYEYRKEDEIADLRAERELMQRDLKAVEERLKQLEKKD